ncbi:uncharacterized protein LOC144647031 [Oculina patagonica]
MRIKTTTCNLASQQRSKSLFIALIMKIICAGFQKTGTKSIAKALRHLGFTVFDWEEQTFDFMDHWVDVFQNGAKPDVKRVYQNADAAVDMPVYFFYEEILEAFPDCKVILSEREEDSWVKSWARQLESLKQRGSKFAAMLSPTVRKMNYIGGSYFNATFGSHNPKSTYVFRKRYRIHNHRVKSIVPADKLLVYNVKQGWKPLCDFLECDVPTVPFPHENIKAEITETLPMTRMAQQMNGEVQRRVFAIASVIVVILITVLAICFNP